MMLSRYLSRAEYSCQCCGELPPDYGVYPYEDFFDIFNDIREEWGKPIIINSGYRCPEHNSSLPGSSPYSAHIFGLALDCKCKDDAEVDKLYAHIVRMYPALRIGRYYGLKPFIHMDCAFLISPRCSEKWHQGARW